MYRIWPVVRSSCIIDSEMAVELDEIEYFHVRLDAHDVIFAHDAETFKAHKHSPEYYE